MPWSRVRIDAALMPSQVALILIRILSFGTPCVAYREMTRSAAAIVASVLKEWMTSTSVDTRPVSL